MNAWRFGNPTRSLAISAFCILVLVGAQSACPQPQQQVAVNPPQSVTGLTPGVQDAPTGGNASVSTSQKSQVEKSGPVSSGVNQAAAGAQQVRQGGGDSLPPRLLWLLASYVLLLVLFMAVLHLWDSAKAYKLSSIHDEVLGKVKELSPDQFVQVLKQLENLENLSKQPEGMPGTTRSIVAYSLVLVLGIGIFHILAFTPDLSSKDTADKLLTVLSGSLTAIIGFYFGAKATREGVEAGASQKPEETTPPPALIDRVEPPSAKRGDPVIIRGKNFGQEQGSVEFGGAATDSEVVWGDTAINAKVPQKAPVGKIEVAVNPSKGNKTVAHDKFEVTA